MQLNHSYTSKIRGGKRYVEVQDGRSLAGETVVGVLDQVGLDFHIVGRRQCQVLVGQVILRGLSDLLNNQLPRAAFKTQIVGHAINYTKHRSVHQRRRVRSWSANKRSRTKCGKENEPIDRHLSLKSFHNYQSAYMCPGTLREVGRIYDFALVVVKKCSSTQHSDRCGCNRIGEVPGQIG